MKKHVRELSRLARQHGRTLERTGGGHYRLSHPDKPDIVTSATPSCPRTLANLRAELRRQQ